MNAKFLLLMSVLAVGSCNFNITSPSESSSNGSTSDSSIVEQPSSSIENSSSDNDISSEDSTPDINVGVDTSDKEYYKSLVDRDRIVYSPDFENDPTKDISKLQIFQINDTHGAYYNDDSIVGISKVATCIKENTIDDTATVKIANGDMLQGTAFSNMLLGEPAIASLNEMNFDAFVIGNHEFDWRIDNLAVYKDGNLLNGELECSFLGANIIDGNGNRPEWIQPYTVVQKGDVKVGILGIIGENLESSISKASLGGYSFTSTLDAVNKYSKVLLEEENVDVLIVSEHNHSEASNASYVKNNKIDCIINAHDHQRVKEYVTRYDGMQVPVVESYTKNGCMGLVTLNLDSNNKMISNTTTHLWPEDYKEDTNLKAIMDVYYEVTSAYQNEVIGYKEGGFSKQELGISTCTYIAAKYDVDIAITNTGGVRASITASEITNALIYEAFPFDNELYIATVSGNELYSLCSRSGNYFNQSGLGNGTNVKLTSIDRSKTYKVICVDYLATKDYYANLYFNEEHDLIKTGDYIRECAIENIKANYKK